MESTAGGARDWGRGSRIIGVGHYQPEKIVDNDTIAALVDTSDEWIRQRVGIITRRFTEDESVADLAVGAARDALARAGMEPADIDLIIVATCSNIERSPSAAGRVADALGALDSAAFEINAACSGFVYALASASQALAAGTARRALVIGADAMSQVADWTDRSTCILVGDGAGAVILEAAEQSQLSPVTWGSVPEMTEAVLIGGAPTRFAQEGRKVFRWAITEAANWAGAALERAGVRAEEVSAFVPHQANLRIIEPLAAQLGIPAERLADDIRVSGNTSAASIPLALSKHLQRNRVEPGTPMLLFGFGGGFAYAGLVALAPGLPEHSA